MEHASVPAHESADAKAASHLENLSNGTARKTAGVKPKKSRRTGTDEEDPSKRRCVSTACVACRKRKSKCDGNLPACAACASVYGTTCVYDPNSDQRRKGVYKNDGETLQSSSTLQTLIEAILNYQEEEAFNLVREIRQCESLDAVAEQVIARENGTTREEEIVERNGSVNGGDCTPTFEKQLYGKIGDLRLDDGSVRYIGGTSNLIHVTEDDDGEENDQYVQQEDPITSWTTVTDDPELVVHLLNMYFTWHYTYFTTLSKSLFYKDFMFGRPPPNARRKTHYCTPLLVNAMLALGCHFTSHRGGRQDPDDSATAGDHFFKEAKRLILENDEHERPRLTTVQALALMSVREAGCGREAKGWVYSGMSFRMALDMGLNLNTGQLTTNKHVNGDEAEEDVRRITFWGCFLFDKCWSNYLGRLPQLPTSIVTVPKFEVFPDEDSSNWSPYSDSGYTHAHAQPSRTRATAFHISKLCEISNDLMKDFYNPSDLEKNRGKATERKMLSDIHRRLENWRGDLPKELEPREGGLSSVLTMHMFFQLLYIHLFRPFLKYTKETSPLPDSVSPRKHCTAAASMISKLMRLYKRSHGLRQICNVCVYFMHSACTIHLLNLPEKGARRDIVHGVKHLEEIAEGWLCARRSLGLIAILAKKWKVELPEDAVAVLERAETKFGSLSKHARSPSSLIGAPEAHLAAQQQATNLATVATTNAALGNHTTTNIAAAGAPQQQPASAVRANSDSFKLPPYDANSLQAQTHPSATTTPQNPNRHSMESRGAVASPSDMFGGIEQLLRNSHDWTYRDQAQLATGFENWTPMDMDPALWDNGVVGESGNMGAGGAVVNGAMAQQLPMSNGQYNGYAPDLSVGMNGYLMDPMGGMNDVNLMGYNENDWYQ